MGLNLTSSAYAKTSRFTMIESGAPQKVLKSSPSTTISTTSSCNWASVFYSVSSPTAQRNLGARSDRNLCRWKKPVNMSTNISPKISTCPNWPAAPPVTPNHLIKLFRERAGITPMEYLWQVRLDHAMTLLRKSGLSISEIAYQIGFKNPYHFARRFRARYGTSPRAFRRGDQLEAGLKLKFAELYRIEFRLQSDAPLQHRAILQGCHGLAVDP